MANSTPNVTKSVSKNHWNFAQFHPFSPFRISKHFNFFLPFCVQNIDETPSQFINYESVPIVRHPGFPARILPGFLKIPGRNIQESYQDPARSWKIIQEIQEAKMRKVKISPLGFEPPTSYPPPAPQTLPLSYICSHTSNSKLNKFQLGSGNC